MKLFKRCDVEEGEMYPRNVFITTGKNRSSREDGWYFKITFPFKRTSNYISPTTFEPTTGPMRYSLLYRRRPANEHRGPLGFFVKGWFPCEN